MRLINRADKPPTLHGSRPARKMAVLGGQLARLSARKHRSLSRSGRHGSDSRPGANSWLRQRP